MKRIVRIILFCAVLLLVYLCVESIRRGMVSGDPDALPNINPVENELDTP